MKNPLNKRILKDIKGDISRYLILFLFLTAIIAVCSGYIVAASSLKTAYDKSFKEYNTEDGNFELFTTIDEDTTIEQVTTYENFYVEEKTDDIDSTLRIFKDREQVNKVCLLDGSMPQKDNEIALDRVYSKNNNVEIGDKIKIAGKEFEVCALVALPDYSALYSNNNDMMFDSIKFGIGVVTDKAFNDFGTQNIHYNYSYKYNNPPSEYGGKQEKERAEDLAESLSKKTMLTDFIPRMTNNAIIFSGDDLGRDQIFIIAMLIIITIIIAFVTAVTTTNAISKEANVIGTLRATGYSKGMLIWFYTIPTIIVVIVAAIIGNLLGYTYFYKLFVDTYLNSYSLTNYSIVFNANAFIKTTIIPILLILIINFIVLARMFSLSPLKFIRRDLTRHQRKKALKLNTKIPIMIRFRLRIILQNIPNYLTLFVGILFAGFIFCFGIGLKPLIYNVQSETIENMICNYQYVLKASCETQTEGAEKFCIGSLQTPEKNNFSESIGVYGVDENSKYIHTNLKDKIYISSAYSQKYGLDVGDKLTLNDKYDKTKKYEFKIDGIYEYPSTLAIFMDMNKYNEIFDKDKDYFNCYLSDNKITDIDENLIASVITKDDFTKTTRQLETSMGSLMSIFYILGVAVCALLTFLLSKVIIEKNSQSISMTKILGYKNSEINSVYINATTIVTIVSILVSLPIVGKLFVLMWKAMMTEYSGWISVNLPISVFVKTAIFEIVTFIIVSIFLMGKIKKVPMAQALKNVE